MIQLYIFPTQPGLVSITAGSDGLVGTNTNFKSTDIGKQITIRTSAGDKVFVISAYSSATSITLSREADFSQSNCYYTTDFYELDVKQDFAYSFNYNIADIREPDKRNANYSKTITIPGTKNNNNILGQIFEINVDRSFNPNQRADALILQDTIQVFRGNLQLLQITKEKDLINYNVAVFGALNDLFAKLAVQTVEGTTQVSRLINNLDLSEFDHIPTRAIVEASWTATPGTGYVYPVMNNGKQPVSDFSPIFNIRDIAPCIYVKTIFDKILASVGFTYQSTFLNSNFFKRLINIAPVSTTRNVNVNYSFTVQNITATNAETTLSLRIFDPISNLVQTAKDVIFNFTSSTPELTITDSVSFELLPGQMIYWVNSPGTGANGFQIKSGSNWETVYTTSNIQVDGSFKVYTGSDILLAVGTVTTIVLPSVDYDTNSSYNNTTGKAGCPSSSLASQLPDKVAQRDFVLWIIQLFNLYIMPDKYDPTILYIEPRDSYYNNDNDLTTGFYNSTVVDWSTKVDVGKEVDIIPMGELDSKYYQFSYKSDNDYYNQYYQNLYNENYGDKLICVNNDFLQNIQNIETGFSPTPSASAPIISGNTQPLNEMVLPSIIASNTTGTGNDYNGNLRILYYAGLKTLSAGKNFFVSDGAGSDSFTSYPFSGMVDDPQNATLDLCFEQPRLLFWTYNNPESYPTKNLFNNYYSRFIAEISDKNSALVRMFLHLNIADIYGVDFRNLFFIKDCYYRLNKITDYNPQLQDSVLVEFIKVDEAIAVPVPLHRAPNLKNLQGLTTISASVKPGQLIIGSASGIAKPVSLSQDVSIALNEITGEYDLVVTGIQGIPVSVALPADGAQLQYNAALKRMEWTATDTSGDFLQSGFSNGFA